MTTRNLCRDEDVFLAISTTLKDSACCPGAQDAGDCDTVEARWKLNTVAFYVLFGKLTCTYSGSVRRCNEMRLRVCMCIVGRIYISYQCTP